uniref:Putative programmed cell death protein n=1 Tax=Anopheles aquasalis TaxID=42839 RepID=T1DNV3_ANOAQ
MYAHQAAVLCDLTVPPPAIDDSFPHVKLLEQLSVADARQVEQFLASRDDATSDCSKPQPSDPSVDIPEYRSDLHEALVLLASLKQSKIVLDDLLTSSPDTIEWNTEVERTEQIKELLSAKLFTLEDPIRTRALKRKLAVRRKKRNWQKRRNLRLAEDRKKLLEDREKRQQEIVAWETEWRNRLKQEQAAREELATKSAILADVRWRKARAKRYLRRFEKTIQLHDQRTVTVETEGANTDGGNIPEERFQRSIGCLIDEWKKKLNECVKEEKRLKDELARRSTGNESRRRENRWRKALFGDASASLNRIDRNPLDEFVAVRRAWDVYALPPDNTDQSRPVSQGSAVPFGWVKPPDDPLPEWLSYRVNRETKRTISTAL